MRSFAAVLCCALLCGTACSRPKEAASSGASPSAGAGSRSAATPLPDVVARVNGRAVRLTEILPLAWAKLKRLPPATQERQKVEVLRQVLQEYVERELLLQEAMAQEVTADSRAVDWAYNQLRQAHPDEAEWARYLAGEGLNPQSLKAELRVRQTVATLVEKEAASRGVPPEEARKALAESLRARARIELLL